MINLIENSIKFSKSGDVVEVTIDQYVVADPANQMGVQVRVTDHGIGISAEDRANLFNIFFKS